MLRKFKIATTGQDHNFLWAQKPKNLRRENESILKSHSQQHGDVQMFFL